MRREIVALTAGNQAGREGESDEQKIDVSIVIIIKFISLTV
jgi:hypothetical protein